MVWGNSIGIDVDGRQNGYTADKLSVGIDFLIESEFIYRYTGDGLNWSWQWIGNAQVVTNGYSLELLVPRTAIGNPETIDIIFTADNAAVGGSAIDFVPDSVTDDDAQLDTRFITYSMNGTMPAPDNGSTSTAFAASNPVTGIIIDGNIADWSGVQPIVIDPEDITVEQGSIDFLSIWGGHDSECFYFAWENDGQTRETWGNAVFLDTDLLTNVNEFDLFIRGDNAAVGGTGIDYVPDAALDPARQQGIRKIRYRRNIEQSLSPPDLVSAEEQN